MYTKTILGVPGLWATQHEIVTSIAEQNIGEFLFAGTILMGLKTRQGYDVEIAPYDPRLQEAFRIAGGGRISLPELQTIGKHRHTLYCLSSGVSREEARAMLGVGVALIKAGGIAVKVESAGTAHSAADWLAMAASAADWDIYRAFVALAGAEEGYYSCGMHNLGLPDTMVPRSLDGRVASELLNRFNAYQLTEQPQMANGHTFRINADSPHYFLRKIPSLFPPDDPFHNPFGVWQLTDTVA